MGDSKYWPHLVNILAPRESISLQITSLSYDPNPWAEIRVLMIIDNNDDDNNDDDCIKPTSMCWVTSSPFMYYLLVTVILPKVLSSNYSENDNADYAGDQWATTRVHVTTHHFLVGWSKPGTSNMSWYHLPNLFHRTRGIDGLKGTHVHAFLLLTCAQTINTFTYSHHQEKTCLPDFRPGKTQTSLLSYRSKLESWNFWYSK